MYTYEHTSIHVHIRTYRYTCTYTYIQVYMYTYEHTGIHVHIRVSVRAHVTEGICIPLVAKPDLIRNVTIRGCGRGRST